MPTVYQLDGNAFKDLASFASHFSTALLDDHVWNGSLDALEDILRGGFGTPAEGFIIRIVNTAAARRALGYPATVAWLEDRAQHCHPANRSDFLARLDRARAGSGPTLFDIVVGIIRDHGTGGSESEDNVVLELDDQVSGWPFDQASDVAAVSDALVVSEGASILLVVHYSDDHSWGFFSGRPFSPDKGKIIGMGTALRLDPTLVSIADLPPGWTATREDTNATWTRQPDPDV